MATTENCYEGPQGFRVVFTNAPEGSIMIKRLEGDICRNESTAQKRGLQLCKEWIDENLEAREGDE